MNWKEPMYELFYRIRQGQGDNESIKSISTEIIEKLIADIPEDDKVKNYMRIVKQQLRDKWL